MQKSAERFLKAALLSALVFVGTGASAQDVQLPEEESAAPATAAPTATPMPEAAAPAPEEPAAVAATPAPEPAPAETATTEAPPPPEAPYPGSEESELARRPKEPIIPPQKPLRVDDDGTYHYDTKITDTEMGRREGVEVPQRTTSTGDFYYDTKSEPNQFSGRQGVETPMQITSEGSYHYETDRTPMTGAASFRLGALIAPPDINQSGYAYKDVYGDNPVPVMLGDYEWRLTSAIGRLSLKFGSGVVVSSGQGRFVNGNPEPAEERMTFIVLPNTLTANYKFQYAENQIIVPYVEGGGGYFTYAEVRDDNRRPKFGGSLVTVAAGGLNFLLDALDKRAIRTLDNEYGINHVWLTLEGRLVVGINKEVDFTSQIANAGVLVEF